MSTALPASSTQKILAEQSQVAFSDLSAWRSRIGSFFAHFEFEALSDRQFAGRIAEHQLGQLKIFHIVGSEHLVRRNLEHINYGEAPQTIVTFHLTGAGTVTRAGVTNELNPQEIFFLRSNQAFELRYCEPMETWIVAVPAEVASHQLLSSMSISGVPMPAKDGPGRVVWDLLGSLVAELDRLSSGENIELSRVLVHAINTMAAAFLVRNGNALVDNNVYQIDRIRLYVFENIRDPELTPSAVAAALGISSRHMNKLFEPEKLTVGQLIRTRRLEGAMIDLCNPLKPNRRVAEIAYDWGFNSASHFCRLFKKHFGRTPKDLQHEARNGVET